MTHTPKWSSRTPEPGDRKPNPTAVAIGAVVGKVGEYAMLGLIFAAMCAAVALIPMTGLRIMHDNGMPYVPAVGYVACWAFIWTVTATAVFMYNVLISDGGDK